MKTKEMRQFVDTFTESRGGSSVSDCQRDGKCLSCKASIRGFKDELSFKEWKLSGLCQSCQDEVFDE